MARPPQQSPVELRVGGEIYRVKATATEATLLRLADVVDVKLKAYQGARAGTPQALLLAAMSLANDLEEERARRVAAEERTKQMLRTIVAKLDALVGDGASLGLSALDSSHAAPVSVLDSSHPLGRAVLSAMKDERGGEEALVEVRRRGAADLRREAEPSRRDDE